MKLCGSFLPLLIAVTAMAAVEGVSLDTGSGVLYGTLELPAAKPPFPMVLFVAGSGPTDRDGNNPILKGKNNCTKMMAETLAARGIASLRYDKRGIAASLKAGLKEQDLRFDMYVDDAVRWGEYLRKDSRFDRLAIAGHSEGSLIGIVAAARLHADGLISIAGSGRPAGETILAQYLAQPLTADLKKQVEDTVKAMEEGRTVASVSPELAPMFRPSIQPYIISWFRFDPAREMAKLAMPVLILQGTTDIQVSMSDAQLLAKANPGARLVLVEGMNHVLKMAPADRATNVAAYSDPSLPVSPRVLDEISTMVNGLKRPQ